MMDSHGPAPGPASNGHVPAGGGDPDASAGEQAMVLVLRQAAALRYPAPDADAAWRRVLAAQPPRAARGGVPERALQALPATSVRGQHLGVTTRAMPPAASPPRVPWRSLLGLAALAAVMVLGLVGSTRGIVTWPPFPGPTGDTGTMLHAASPEDDNVLALDPSLLTRSLGAGWDLSSTWAGVADVGAPDFTGFLGSTRLVWRGPNEAAIIVEMRPVATDPAAAAMAWTITQSDALAEFGESVDAGSRQQIRVQGCSQATHMEGSRNAKRVMAHGFTLCAVAASEVVLVATSGEVLGDEGAAASDRVAAFVAAELAEAPIVPTHRYAGSGATARGLLQSPLPNAPVVQPLAWGTPLRWTGDAAASPDPQNPTPWLKMRSSEGMEGWAPGALLVPTVVGQAPGSYPLPTPTVVFIPAS